MKLRLKMSIKTLVAVNKCLISVIVWLSQNSMIIQTNRLLAKRKMKLQALKLKNL